VTDEKWTNKDGTSARGWLLRGSENAPGVILLHKFGADRSYELDLGVKLNEATNFTVLMPDLRGHGETPAVDVSAFGGHESDDTLAAVDFLRSLKTPDGVPLVGSKIGAYGVELGGLAALGAAVKDPSITAVALDSVPADSTAVIAAAVERRFPFGSSVTSQLARFGARAYFYKGSFENLSTCDAGKAIAGRKIMLLSGFDVPDLQASTTKLGRCIQSGPNVETKYDLSPSGYNIITASLEKSQDYEQRVIDFFRLALAG
jgi:pimeloyl-ACP methyl ester carboxylesterase